MNAAYLSALSALAGSAIGALASFATTWLTQRHTDKAQRAAQEGARREKLYGDFIDQASKLYIDALTHGMDDPSKMVPLYAIMNRLRLFASRETVMNADQVGRTIIETFYKPNEDFRSPTAIEHEGFDILRQFTESCRRDLTG